MASHPPKSPLSIPFDAINNCDSTYDAPYDSPYDSLGEIDSSKEIYLSIGSFLKKMREESNLSIGDVSKAIKIRAFFINCIEVGNFADLPGGIYTWGFVKSYCELLNIETKSKEYILANFAPSPSPKQTAEQTYNLEKAFPSNRLLIISALVSLFIVLLFNYFTVSNTPPTVNYTYDSPTQLTTYNQVNFNSPPKESLDYHDKVINNSINKEGFDANSLNAGFITFYALNQTWVKITNGTGKVILIRLLSANEQYCLPFQPDLYLTTGLRQDLLVYIGKNLITLPRPSINEISYHKYDMVEDFPLNYKS